MNAVDWALTREGLTAPKQLLLTALAWITDEDGVTFKAQATIAERMGRDPRWVRQHLPALAADGLLSRYRRHRMNGSRTTDLIVLNLPRERDVDLTVYDGIVGELEPGDRPPSGENPPQDLAAGSGRPSGENPPPRSTPLNQPRIAKEENARASADAFPDDLPADLHDVAIAAGKVLKATAMKRGQPKAVTRAAVGQAVMSWPDRDHVQVARDVEYWLLHGNGAGKSCRDVVARFRSFLKSSEPRAAGPMAVAASGNVRPIRPRGGAMTASDLLEAGRRLSGGGA